MTKLKVGISAVFDSRITPHAATFLHGIAVAKNSIPEVAGMELVFADDGASGAVALQVAHRFIEQEVDVVIGHFSSDAALRIANLYEAHSIPLLLPAATACELTRKHRNVFRLCPNDKVLAARLASHIADTGISRVAVYSDCSSHGMLVADEVRIALSAIQVQHSNNDERAEALVFCGRLATSARFLAERRSIGDERAILMTDDAVSQSLLGDFNAGDVRVFGLVPCQFLDTAARYLDVHRQCFATEPNTYFTESIAALQIAAQLRGEANRLSALIGGEFSTALGMMSFKDGDLREPIHALWRARGGQLQVDALLEGPINRL